MFGAILYGMVQGHNGMNKTRYMVSCPWADRVDEYLKNKAAVEAMDKALMRIAEQPNTYKPLMVVRPGETKTELFRLGAPLHEILCGEDDDVA